MSVAKGSQPKELRILWILLENGSLRMMWAGEEPVAGWNDKKERCHGR
jgi:hypothetical protein